MLETFNSPAFYIVIYAVLSPPFVQLVCMVHDGATHNASTYDGYTHQRWVIKQSN